MINPDFDIISKDNMVVFGIVKKNLDAEVLHYPNPTSNNFNIKKQDLIIIEHIRTDNTLGHLIYSSVWTNTIDQSSFSSSLFFVAP